MTGDIAAATLGPGQIALRRPNNTSESICHTSKDVWKCLEMPGSPGSQKDVRPERVGRVGGVGGASGYTAHTVGVTNKGNNDINIT